MNSPLRADAAQSPVYPDAKGRYGSFGGRYVPETLVPALGDVAAAERAIAALGIGIDRGLRGIRAKR